jgi:peptidoglycan-associated lipoprotein
MRTRLVPIAVVAALMSMAACRRDPPPPPAPTGPTAEELARARQDSIARVRARQDSIDAAAAARDRAAQADRDRAASAQRTLRTALEAMVHFEYDESDITPEGERILRDKVDILRANPEVRIRVEGHADERGSTEYNQALASRRAQSVKNFITGFGLDGGRFETVSFGEERPLVNRSDEDAWSQNRRAEFIITGGGATLTAPR